MKLLDVVVAPTLPIPVETPVSAKVPAATVGGVQVAREVPTVGVPCTGALGVQLVLKLKLSQVAAANVDAHAVNKTNANEARQAKDLFNLVVTMTISSKTLPNLATIPNFAYSKQLAGHAKKSIFFMD